MPDSHDSYQHTQPAIIMFVFLAIGVLIVAFGWRRAAGGVPAGAPRTILLALLGTAVAGVTIVTLMFSSLTIAIRDGTLQWHFTGGLFRDSIALRDVERVSQVRNPVATGWGIRKTMNGTLYRVSGLDAVHIQARGGRAFSLGSDEPQRLVQAIEAARARAGAP